MISLQNISVFDAQSNTIPVKTEGLELFTRYVFFDIIK